MILLTGGAGFIGSNILSALNRLGLQDIILVDNLHQAAKHRNLNNCRFSDYIPKEKLLEELPRLPKPDFVLHQGACSSTTESDGRYMMENNYEYSKKLLHYCIEHKVPLIYAGSAAVYGDGIKGFDDSRDDYFSLNIYAFSKLLFDRYVRRILKKDADQSPILGLRYFNVYGYQENHKGNMASLPFQFFQQWKAGKKFRLFEGSERFFRDFIFVEDIAKVVLHFMEAPQSGIYNVGTGTARCFQSLADILLPLLPGADIEYIPFPEALKNQYQTFTLADISKLRKAGYKATFTNLEKGLEKYMKVLNETGGYI